MARYSMIVIFVPTICTLSTGCMSRAIKEGAGVVTGASDRVIHLVNPPSLSHYRGVKIESITVIPGLDVPDNLSSLVQEAYAGVSEELKLSADGTPGLLVKGQIIHYEPGGLVDTAIGPLEEIIVRTELSDSETQKTLGSANLIGRSKAVTSSGAGNLSKGAGKALKKWLKEEGLAKDQNDKSRK